MNNPFSLFDQTREAYLRYLDSPFRLRYDALMKERRDLLNTDRQLFREPLFEPLPPYTSSKKSVADAAKELGAPLQVGEFLRQKLFEPFTSTTGVKERELYTHQLEAWEASRNGHAVVVTSGTGSGKTECYLVPMFASLIEEAVTKWKAPCPSAPSQFWWNERGGRTRANGNGQEKKVMSQRDYENKARPAAVRALLMYPLNALIEDQLGRIRDACDSATARGWLNSNLDGHRLWFGRYNGSTPIAGPSDSLTDTLRDEYRKRMKQMQREWESAVRSAVARGDNRILSFFQDPAGAEMWGRWDMQETPPDILITNYSMLNIMLMRDIESDIFTQTRDWLAESKDNHFHLIVDELHTYRGTSGTEVAYLLRAFLHRIGLEPDSPQLRIIATSASIENDNESLEYLEGFFGRRRDDFKIFSGTPRSYGAARTGGLSLFASAFSKFGADLDNTAITLSQAAGDLAGALPVPPAEPDDNDSEAERQLERSLRGACAVQAVRAASIAPQTAEQMADSIFGGVADTSERSRAIQGLLRAMVLARGADGLAPLPVRAHLFFHNAGRLWACANPNCTECGARSTPAGEPKPPVGQIYTEPRPRCKCGGRVLELLYCEPCGEVFLGGYKRDGEDPNTWDLTADYSDLDRVPDRGASPSRTFGDYLVFWPSLGEKTIKAGNDWAWQDDGKSYSWKQSRLDMEMGQVRLKWSGANASEIKGYVYEAPEPECAGLPHRCPQCGEDWFGRTGINSPVRDLGSGFQRIVQLLMDSMLREMPIGAERKLVLFSDSRQDAAKLSTGVKRAHHLDTLRQVAFRRLAQAAETAQADYLQKQQIYADASQLLQIEVELLQGNPIDKNLRKLLNQKLKATEEGQKALAQIPSFASDLEDDSATQIPLELQPPAAPPDWTALSFDDLTSYASERLLVLGMNPGGTQPSLALFKPPGSSDESRWEKLVDWDATPVAFTSSPKAYSSIQHLNKIYDELKTSLWNNVLFASGSRDFESLKLGVLWVKKAPPKNIDEEIAAGVLRLLSRRRLSRLNTRAKARTQPPGYVKAYLTVVEEKLGGSAGLTARVNERIRSVEVLLGSSLMQWIVQPSAIFVLSPQPGVDGCIPVYDCSRCGRRHLHAAGGVCIICQKELPATPKRELAVGPITDYYEYLARTPEAEFRLNCQELTGQTDADERRQRQRLFQEVFMEGEAPQADGVDLLSVTTTMEAGVDIGALQGIGMANMPPVRFNYQQRVGRAGRRGRGLSVALTLCRGRSHDDYYFERPELITAEKPPKPYVDLKRESLARRVVNKEILRRAFENKPIPADESERGGDDVHGEFGACAAWVSTMRGWVQGWLADSANASVIREVCEAILRRSALPGSSPVNEMEAWIKNGLLGAVDGIVALTGPQESASLAKRLASHGLLPMFGFPTRVRLLYHARPQMRGKAQTVDRDLDIAIGQFAPGAQTVKDDQLLTAVGVVEYKKSRGEYEEVPNPLRDPKPVGVCRRCGEITAENPVAGPCPVCAAPAGEDGYSVMEINEPPGFCTVYKHSAEFGGSFEFTPRALRARLGTKPQSPVVHCNAVIDALEQARVYRINDNGGKGGFEFVKRRSGESWFVKEAFEASQRQLPDDDFAKTESVDNVVDTNQPPLTRALASISTTDVMTVGLGEVPVGLTLNAALPEAKAAWYSFGFLLQRAAAVRLDINASEIDMGLQPFKDPTVPFEPPSARIFLSDSHENGAGYSTYFSEPERFENLLRFILGMPQTIPTSEPEGKFYGPLVSDSHREECASSCHRCLREFGNMGYHALLDWRLALDMARLALDKSAPIDLEQPFWKELLDAQAPALLDGFDLTPRTIATLRAGVDTTTNEAFLLVHPLWGLNPANHCAALAEACAEAVAQGLKPRPWSVFRAIRFPFELPKP